MAKSILVAARRIHLYYRSQVSPTRANASFSMHSKAHEILSSWYFCIYSHGFQVNLRIQNRAKCADVDGS